MIYLRKAYDNILMILSFSLMFFMLTNITYWSLDTTLLENTDYKYSETYKINGTLSEEVIKELASFWHDRNCNCVIPYNYLAIGDGYYAFACDLYLTISELPQKNKINIYSWMNSSNSVFLGQNFQKLVQEKQDASEIIIHGLNYHVNGFLPKRDLEDKRAWLFWGNMDSHHREGFVNSVNSGENPEYFIRIESNQDINSESWLNYFNGKVELVKTINAASGLMSFQSKMLRQISVVLLCFLAIACAMITNLWMERRKREYLICRTFGYDKINIITLIVKENGRITAISLVLAWIFEELYVKVVIGIYMNTAKTAWTLIFSFVGAVIIQFIILSIPVIKLLKTYPTQGNVDSI